MGELGLPVREPVMILLSNPLSTQKKLASAANLPCSLLIHCGHILFL